jgi:hypothetical protein
MSFQLLEFVLPAFALLRRDTQFSALSLLGQNWWLATQTAAH